MRLIGITALAALCGSVISRSHVIPKHHNSHNPSISSSTADSAAEEVGSTFLEAGNALRELKSLPTASATRESFNQSSTFTEGVRTGGRHQIYQRDNQEQKVYDPANPQHISHSSGLSQVSESPVRRRRVRRGNKDNDPLEDDYPADDHLWNAVRCKGTNFNTAFKLSDAEAGKFLNPEQTSAHSPFTADSLQAWGFQDCSVDDYVADFSAEGWAISTALEALRLSGKSTHFVGDIHVLELIHGDCSGYRPFEMQTYIGPDGRIRGCTGAHFTLGVDPIHGVIIAMDVEGVAQAARSLESPVPKEDYPDIKQSSDIMWAQWARLARGDNIKNLNYFFSISITNRGTRSVLKRALAEKQKTLEKWPGTFFEMTEEQGQAILATGTPNGVGIGFILMQRKPELGNKFIKGVYVFKDDSRSGSGPCLAFQLMSDGGSTGIGSGGAGSETPPLFPRNVTSQIPDGTKNYERINIVDFRGRIYSSSWRPIFFCPMAVGAA